MIDRYGLSPMKEVWTLKSQYEHWLKVELAVLLAMEEAGDIPPGTHGAVSNRVHVDDNRIASIESEIHHDLLAFIRSLEEQAGDPGRFIHLGLTSSDVKDTALSLQMCKGLDLIIDEGKALQKVLMSKSREYKDLIIVGRTHGMHAEPTTLGLKLLLLSCQLGRDIERLQLARREISVGKFSGPVGTYTQISLQVEQIACEKLGLSPTPIANQILQRDRHAQVLSSIAIAGATLEKMALEIRHLSRTEVGELEEPVPEGSSSMPHKRNPITSERICGLARLLRGNLQAGVENISLWHERDMSHSSVERVIIPDSFILLHYMIASLRSVIEQLVVHEEAIAFNLGLTGGAIYSQAILVALVKQGMPRVEAHQILTQASIRAKQEQRSLIDVVYDDDKTAKLMKACKLDEQEILERVRAISSDLIEEQTKKTRY